MQFEKEFASYIGCKHALAVNSGTSALQLALDAIGLQPSDEVLVPTYTFTASAEVVTYFGVRPLAVTVSKVALIWIRRMPRGISRKRPAQSCPCTLRVNPVRWMS